ncbi:hypothetical protein [Anaerovorax sp. IOR16]|uniref:hypothetical protein n=1 Tax=Anaerovorax sp. IOR16 TaxID=2773458 RepID=UPI0019D0A725|nr:hypothetical protein [Anaerovorax sp. IOR16]
MKYYEIWFYYYGDDDNRTDYFNEFTFYCKTEKPITTDNEMIAHLKSKFPMTDEYYWDKMNCIYEEHYKYMSKWFEITAEEFEDGCGIPA